MPIARPTIIVEIVMETHVAITTETVMTLEAGCQNLQQHFPWGSTQNIVYGHCNRCGIEHIPAQCLNQSSSSAREQSQANYTAFSNRSTSGSRGS